MSQHKRPITELQVLDFMINNHDFCERLANELEIQADSGESAGAFVTAVAQGMHDDHRRAIAQQWAERVEDSIAMRARREGVER